MITVAEVSYAVGFASTSYFAKVFAERFGKKPSDYLF
jgi:AraC-like DNA-binding protein